MERLDAAVLAYYEQGREAGRLTGDGIRGRLELVRTQELLRRHLPGGTLEVLDIGGGAGVYATWLADLGHHVHLVDPVPLHVEQARAADGRIGAEVGDARDLRRDDASADVVLLLGPLYHLIDRDDRLLALREALRVLRPGGLLCAAGIARLAGLMDHVLLLDRFHEPVVRHVMSHSVETGELHGAEHGIFTTAYLHRPDDLRTEIAEAGFDAPRLFAVEGPGCVAGDLQERWDDPDRREALLDAARLVEEDPAMQTIGGHILAVARSPR